MLGTEKIVVCEENGKRNSLYGRISSMGFSCIRVDPDKGQVVKTVLTLSPDLLIADMESIRDEELSKALDVLDSNDLPLCLTLGNHSAKVKHHKNTIAFSTLPDRERLKAFIERKFMNNNESRPNYEDCGGLSDAFLERDVTEIIQKIGIAANIKGYRYIRTAVILAVNDMSILENVTKRLYPTIAHINGTTPTRVERAIRHAITTAWDRSDRDFEYIERELRCKIRFAGAKPTNSELIAIISDCLRIRNKTRIKGL